VLAQVTGREAFGSQAKEHQRTEERDHPRVEKAQPGHSPAVDNDGPMDAVHGPLGDGAVVAESLDVRRTSACVKADLPQRGEVGQATIERELQGVVDRGFGTEGASFLVVLLDAAVLGIDMQRGHHAVGQHAGANAARVCRVTRPIEDQLHLMGRRGPGSRG